MTSTGNPAGGKLFGWSDDPVMPVGKYRGVPISKLPVSYCRWILMQKFAPDIIAAAQKKVDASPINVSPLTLSRHALDMFSLRFLDYWLDSGACATQGMATFVVEYAERAWNEGKDVSKHRHEDDGIVKLIDDVCFVFAQSPSLPDYREVITCYPDPDSPRARRYPHPSSLS